MGFSLSYSKIETYMRCPFQYKCMADTRTRRQFAVDTSYMLQGNLIHGTLNSFYKELPPEARNLDNLRGLYEKKFKANSQKHLRIFKTKTAVDKAVLESQHQFVKFLQSLYGSVAPHLDTEDFVKCDIGGCELIARIDRVDLEVGGLHIIDYKTGKLHEEEPDTLQLDIYELLISSNYKEYPVERKSYFYLMEGKFIDVLAKKSEITKTADFVQETAEIIKKDTVFAAKENNKCRFCDYKPICPLKS